VDARFDSGAVLGLYELALARTREMLDAARAGDWDGLVQRERERAVLVERLKEHDPDPARDGAMQERKREILLEISRADEQIHTLTQDWMHELRDVLGGLGTLQRLT
jgi:flagellar protein FliT